MLSIKLIIELLLYIKMEDLRDLKIVILVEEYIGKTCILDSFLGMQFDINSK